MKDLEHRQTLGIALLLAIISVVSIVVWLSKSGGEAFDPSLIELRETTTQPWGEP